MRSTKHTNETHTHNGKQHKHHHHNHTTSVDDIRSLVTAYPKRNAFYRPVTKGDKEENVYIVGDSDTEEGKIRVTHTIVVFSEDNGIFIAVLDHNRFGKGSQGEVFKADYFSLSQPDIKKESL